MHRLLQRQIKKHLVLSEQETARLRELLDAVDSAYVEYDDDRAMLERSIEISSQELLQANAETRAILKAFPDLFFRLDASGVIRDVKGGESLDFLVPRERLLGRRIQDIPNRTVGGLFQEAVASVAASRQPASFDYCLEILGKPAYYEVRIQPALESQMIAIVRNITDRKKAIENLALQRQFLRQVIDLNPNFIFAKDREGRFTLVNQAVADAYGTSVGELVGKSDADFNSNVDEVEAFRRDDLRVLSTGDELFVPEEQITDASGRVRWLQTIKRSITSLDTCESLVLGVATDITERKRAEEDNHRSLSLLKATLDSTADGILVVDAAGKIVCYNRQFETLWRIPAEVLKEHRDDLALSFVLEQLTDPQAFLDRVQALYQHPDMESFDVLQFKDGRVFERYSRSQILGDVGLGRVWSFRDVTEQAKAQAALRQSEEQLRQSQKMEAIGTLAGGVAHDFNNILTVILGHSQLIKQRVASEPTLADRIEEVIRAAERAAGLTRQLLAFSRKQVINPKRLNVNTIVVEMEKMLQRVIGEDIVLRKVLAEGTQTICADPGQLEQVLMNLVVNARDAMPMGGELTIKTETVDLDAEGARGEVPAGRYVMLSVSDTGQGMNKATQQRVFEPFFTTKEQGKGTGLGLSTVYGIVQQSSGMVNVHSEIGVGTVFKLYFPAVSAAVESPNLQAHPAGATFGHETILLVEDEEVVRRLVAELLVKRGYRVLQAADGAVALEQWRDAQGIDLLITDVVMPHIGGSTLAAELRSSMPDLKVLFMSGYTDDAIIRHGIVEGTPFLEKPFSLDALANKVREVLDTPRSSAA